VKKLGLLGANISHSKSKKMYEELLNEAVDYTLFDFPKPDLIPPLTELFSMVEGLSITAPYKKHFLSSVVVASNIKELNAINCVKKSGDIFLATNTDFLAVKELFLSNFRSSRVIILGDGSMAKITQVVLDELDIKYDQYSRKKSGDISRLDLSSISKKSVIINTCSRSFTFLGELPKSCTFWDYNYAHSNHELMPLNPDQHYLNGLSLLKLQAKFALEYWSNC